MSCWKLSDIHLHHLFVVHALGILHLLNNWLMESGNQLFFKLKTLHTESRAVQINDQKGPTLAVQVLAAVS